MELHPWLMVKPLNQQMRILHRLQSSCDLFLWTWPIWLLGLYMHIHFPPARSWTRPNPLLPLITFLLQKNSFFVGNDRSVLVDRWICGIWWIFPIYFHYFKCYCDAVLLFPHHFFCAFVIVKIPEKMHFMWQFMQSCYYGWIDINMTW